MLVERNTLHLKRGKQEELLELCKQANTMLPVPYGLRVLTSIVGPFDKVIVELQFENRAEYTDWQDKWFSSPETPAFMEKWNELFDPGGGREIWDVVEL